MTQKSNRHAQADPTEGLMSPHWDTGGTAEDVSLRPTLVLADTRAPSLGIIRRLRVAPPEEGAALVGTHRRSQWLLAVTSFTLNEYTGTHTVTQSQVLWGTLRQASSFSLGTVVPAPMDVGYLVRSYRHDAIQITRQVLRK